ncbi:DUF4145 domain-containing protein [Thermodesulfobacteriota bacterium]
MAEKVPVKQCPHCLVALNFEAAGGNASFLAEDGVSHWTLAKAVCPACNRLILYLKQQSLQRWEMIYPRRFTVPCPPGVPEAIAEDYKEVCLVLNDSPKASVALSRRCVQNILEQVAGIPPGQLAPQIDKVIESRQLPPNITKELDAIRNIGMFAVHPKRSQSSGEIVSATREEAKWCISIIYSMLSYYFMALPESERRIDSLNKKLQDMGKPPMKDGEPET